MKKPRILPKIKAVELVRTIRDAHYEQIKHLSPQEKIAFFRNKASTLHAELKRPEERFEAPHARTRHSTLGS
jgi:hypothetical protein